MRQMLALGALVLLAGCATTTVNGVPVDHRRNIALTVIGVAAAGLILSEEREQDSDHIGVPEHGCEECGIERLPGPVPGD